MKTITLNKKAQTIFEIAVAVAFYAIICIIDIIVYYS